MYIDGYVYAVPKSGKQSFIDYAQKTAELFVKYGAIRVVECWGDHFDDAPDHANFSDAVKCKDDEQVMFSWCEWPDKQTRNESFEAMMEEMTELGMTEMPFDGKRMIFGGFVPVVEA